MRLTRPLMVVVLFTATWVVVGALVLRDVALRHGVARGREVAWVEDIVADVHRRLEREARLLAADPDVVAAARRADAAALDRARASRLLALAPDDLADLILVVDGQGQAALRVPAGAPLGRVITPGSSTVRVIDGRPYVAAMAPLDGTGAIVAARSIHSLGSALARGRRRAGLAAVDGAQVIGWTFDGALPARVASGAVEAHGQRWAVRPLGSRAGLHLAALVPDAGMSTESRAMFVGLGVTLVVALLGIAVAAGRARAPTVRPVVTAGDEPDAPSSEIVPDVDAVASPLPGPRDDGAPVSAQRMAALVDLGRLLSETLDPEVVARRIVDSLRLLLRAHSAALLRLVPETSDLVVVSVAETSPTFAPGTVFPHGMGTSGWVVLHREPIITPDLLSDPRIVFTPHMRTRIETAGYRSVLTLPLMMQDRVIGALTVADAAGRVFTDEEVRLARAFGDQAAVAFENARLFAEGGRRRREAEEMARVARTLTESLDVRAVAQRIVDSVLPLFGAAMSGLRMLEPDGTLLLVALGGRERGRFDLRHAQGTDEGLLGAVVVEGRPLSSPAILDDPRFAYSDRLRAYIKEAGHQSLLAVPLRVGPRPVGVLYIATLDERHFTSEEALLLQAFGDQAALALENARLYAKATRRLDETQALLDVAEILNSTLDATQVLERVTRKIAQVCRVDRASIQRWDGDRVVPLMSQFADGRRHPDMWRMFSTMSPTSPRDVPAHARAIETRRPVVIDDASQSDLIPRAWLDAYEIKSYMVVPLIRHDVLIGVMNLDHHERPVPFEPAQVDLALAIAGQLALFLENARLYAEARERLWETTTLVAVSEALSQSGPTVEIMRRVAREMTRAFGADMTGVYVLDAAHDRLIPLAGHHVPRHLLETFRTTPVPIARYPKIQEAWRAGRGIWSRDPAHDERFEATWGHGLPAHSVLFAAALSRGEPVGGMFVLWWGATRTMRPAQVRLIEAIAAQVGLAFENLDLTRRTEIKLRETETLLAISRALSTTLDQDALLREFLRRMASAIEADSVAVWTMDESGDWLLPLVEHPAPAGRRSTTMPGCISVPGTALYAEAARTKRPVFSRDVRADARAPDTLRDVLPHGSHLVVPIVVKDRMIGALVAVWWDGEREFSDSDVALCEAIANQAGIALENLRLFDENRRRMNELSVLYDLSRAVTGQLAHDAVVAAIETHVARVLPVQTLVVVLRYPDSEAAPIVYTSVQGVRKQHTLGRPDDRPPGLVSVVLDSGRPLRTDDYVGECARHGVGPIRPGLPVRSVLIVPMIIGDTTIGAVGVGSRDHSFTAADERLVSNIADLAALALSSARLFEDRTRAYRDLAAAQDQLVRTEKLRALGEMASGIAHDFNNLLAAILGRAQLLLGRVQDPQLVRWLQVVERSALDGAQTVRRLQEFTRMRRDAPLVAVDVNEVIADAVEMTQSRWRDEAQSRGITIDVDTDLAPVPAVAGDAAGLREVFTNLILNAVDAMPAGGQLRLSTRATDAGIDVVVRDTGTGMSETVRKRIFEPFFTTKGPQGTGLGLAMAYGIVSRHGGSITVESAEGEGSTFRLGFPLTADVAPASPAVIEPPATVSTLRCLVVDDEETVGMVLGDVLEMIGHEVVVVTDPAAAVERFRAESFDIVFTDLAMPGFSGWQVTRAVKAIVPSVPVFLVTGFGVELSVEERRTHGVEGVLAKPLRIDEVHGAVSEAARKRAQLG